jgi:hypothetical protein
MTEPLPVGERLRGLDGEFVERAGRTRTDYQMAETSLSSMMCSRA